MNYFILLTLIAGVCVHCSRAHPTINEDTLAELQNVIEKMNADPDDTAALQSDRKEETAVQVDPELIDEQNMTPETNLDDSEIQSFNRKSCLKSLYIMAFTSNVAHAGSNGQHSVEMKVNKCVNKIKLYNLPGDDYKPNKGDLWKIKISDFSFTGCVRAASIESLSIVSSSNDGWNIDSIATFVEGDAKQFKLLTQDFNVNRWIDSNGSASHKRFDLTRV